MKSKGEKRKVELLALARQVLIEQGYGHFSMREIATANGMTLGNLQYYFGTREELVEAVIRAEFDTNLGVFAAISSSDLDGEEALVRVASELVQQWMSEGARVYAVMSFLALHEDRFRSLRDEIYRAFYVALRPLIAAANPNLNVAAQKRKTRVITALLDGALLQKSSWETKGAEKVFLKEIVDTVLYIARS